MRLTVVALFSVLKSVFDQSFSLNELVAKDTEFDSSEALFAMPDIATL